MTTVGGQIQSADEVICRNIESFADQRALLSQNVLSQLRNLVEGAVVRLHNGSSEAEFDYAAVQPGLAFVRSRARLNFLGKFHKLIQKSASHYTLDGDASERLMLKYYEYLHRTRRLLRTDCGLAILANLEAFPIDLDPSLREYHEKIAARIQAVRATPPEKRADRYYIHAAFLTKLKQVEILYETEPKLAMHASWKLRFDIDDAIFRYVIISDVARESIIETFARLDALATVDLSFDLQQQVDHIRYRLAALVARGDLARQAPNLVGLAMRAQDVFQVAARET